MTRFPIDWGDGLLDGCPEPEQPTEEEGQQNDDLLTTTEKNENEVTVADDDDDEEEEEDDDNEEDEEEISENIPNADVTPGSAQLSGKVLDVPEVTASTSNAAEPLHQVQANTIQIDSL